MIRLCRQPISVKLFRENNTPRTFLLQQRLDCRTFTGLESSFCTVVNLLHFARAIHNWTARRWDECKQSVTVCLIVTYDVILDVIATIRVWHICAVDVDFRNWCENVWTDVVTSRVQPTVCLSVAVARGSRGAYNDRKNFSEKENV